MGYSNYTNIYIWLNILKYRKEIKGFIKPSIKSQSEEKKVISLMQYGARDGFELATYTLAMCRSSQLNYSRICRDPGSNWGPSVLQTDALPTELSRLV